MVLKPIQENVFTKPICRQPLKIIGSTIKPSKEEVLLGVRIDSDLTFKEHVTSIFSKVHQKLHALTRVSMKEPFV